MFARVWFGTTARYAEPAGVTSPSTWAAVVALREPPVVHQPEPVRRHPVGDERGRGGRAADPSFIAVRFARTCHVCRDRSTRAAGIRCARARLCRSMIASHVVPVRATARTSTAERSPPSRCGTRSTTARAGGCADTPTRRLAVADHVRRPPGRPSRPQRVNVRPPSRSATASSGRSMRRRAGPVPPPAPWCRCAVASTAAPSRPRPPSATRRRSGRARRGRCPGRRPPAWRETPAALSWVHGPPTPPGGGCDDQEQPTQAEGCRMGRAYTGRPQLM